MQNIKISPLVELFLISVIACFALLLYTHKLGSVPAGFYIDEALPGYNSYSLLRTGLDEYGKSWPVTFRSIGTYPPPLYTYLTIPSVAFFDLNVFSVRLPAAIIGALSVIVFYLIVKSLNLTKSKTTPLLGSLLFAISPWNLLYSRIGFEVGLGFLLFSLGVFFCWKSLNNIKLIIPGFFFLSLSTYAAYSERFLTPLFIMLFLILYKKFLEGKVKYPTLGLLTASIVQIFHLTIFTTPAFLFKSGLFYANDVRSQAEKVSHFIPYFISIVLAFAREFLAKYITYYSPRSLFFLPDPDIQRSLPELSVFYPWMVIPYFVGIFSLVKAKQNHKKFIILLILITPLPAALTSDPFATHRALPLLLPLMLIITLGIDKLIQGTRLKLLFFLLLICFSLIPVWRSYFVLLPKERAKIWGYGFEQLANVIQKNPDEHFIIDQTRIKPAYAELAFFLKYPPEKFQKEVDQSIKNNYYTNIQWDSHYNFGNIETHNIVWEENIYKDQILVGDEFTISAQQATEHFLQEVFEIKDPINQIVFKGFKTNPRKKCQQDLNQNPSCKIFTES